MTPPAMKKKTSGRLKRKIGPTMIGAITRPMLPKLRYKPKACGWRPAIALPRERGDHDVGNYRIEAANRMRELIQV